MVRRHEYDDDENDEQEVISKDGHHMFVALVERVCLLDLTP